MFGKPKPKTKFLEHFSFSLFLEACKRKKKKKWLLEWENQVFFSSSFFFVFSVSFHGKILLRQLPTIEMHWLNLLCSSKAKDLGRFLPDRESCGDQIPASPMALLPGYVYCPIFLVSCLEVFVIPYPTPIS